MADAIIQSAADIKPPAAPQNTTIQTTQPPVAEAQRMQQSTGIKQSTGKTFDANSQEVKNEMIKNPGLSIDAAIGNVAMQQSKTDDAYLAQLKSLDQKQELSKATEIKKQVISEPQQEITTPAQNEFANQLQTISDQSVTEMQSYMNQLDQYAASLDTQTNANIEAIKQTFALRKTAQDTQNKEVMGLMNRAGFTSGRSRYAGEIQTQIVSQEESNAIGRLSALDQQEQDTIRQAEIANMNGDFEILNQKMATFEKIQATKIQTIKDLQALSKDEEDKAMARAKEMREAAIFDIDYAGAKAAQETAIKNDAMATLNLLTQSGTAFEDVDPSSVADIAKKLGLNETVIGNMFESIKQANIAESEGASAEADIKIVNALKDIPAGTQVQIGNRIFTGLKVETPNIGTYTVKDANGNEKTVFYDKNTLTQLDEVQTGFGKDVYVDSNGNPLPEGSQPLNQAQVQQTTEALKLIDDILGSPALSQVIGTSSVIPVLPGTKGNDVVLAIKRIKGMLIMDNLGVLKGPMSDKDLEFIAMSKTELDRGMTEEKFVETIESIKQKFITKLNNNGVVSDQPATLEDIIANDPINGDILSALDAKNPNLNDQELADYFNTLTPEQKNVLSSGYSGLRIDSKGSVGVNFPRVGGDTKQASILNRISDTIPAGTKYTKATDGECGYWSRKIVDYPSGTGNTLQEKENYVAKKGMAPDEWRKQGVKVGDVVFTNESKTYGHVVVVNSVNSDGTITLSESNYKGHYLVSHDRKLPINSPKIIGSVRGTLKV